MFRNFRKNPLRGGAYHIGLIIVTVTAFNLGFFRLTGANLVQRLTAGFDVPSEAVAIALCISAGVVLWSNWVD